MAFGTELALTRMSGRDVGAGPLSPRLMGALTSRLDKPRELSTGAAGTGKLKSAFKAAPSVSIGGAQRPRQPIVRAPHVGRSLRGGRR